MMRMIRCRPRRGTALITVMMVLLIVSMLLLGSLHTFATAAHQQRSADRQLQARWLATSALSRGLAQFQRDPSYQGETWQLSPAELSRETTESITDAGSNAPPKATLTIEIEARGDGALIEATAVLDVHSTRPVRVAKQLLLRD